jgi:hypothetical protein
MAPATPLKEIAELLGVSATAGAAAVTALVGDAGVTGATGAATGATWTATSTGANSTYSPLRERYDTPAISVRNNRLNKTIRRRGRIGRNL